MGKHDKKTGKGRLDKFYKLAKEQGYRARSAFKLIHLNRKYDLLSKSKCCIDLCAAPGGWLQVAEKYMPKGSLIVGLDLNPIKPLPHVTTFVQDITTPSCRQVLRSHLHDWKADLVLHDGAPNVGSAWVQDAFTQNELVLQSLKLATEFLTKGGSFVTKVFRSKDYNMLMWVFGQLFRTVEATKPPSSRNVSAEIFVVCQDYYAPKVLDPRFVDPKWVFKDVGPLPTTITGGDAVDGKFNQPDTQASTVRAANAIAKIAAAGGSAHASVFMPEKKRRHREGYMDGDNTLHHTATASEFIDTKEPIPLLAVMNRIVFETEEEKAWLKSRHTTADILANMEDLKVLGKGDFKQLMKWRLAIRLETGRDVKAEDAPETTEDVTVEPIDEEQQITDELQRLSDIKQARLRRERKRRNEKRTKDVLKLQLNMVAPMDIEMNDNALGGEDVFDLGENERQNKRQGGVTAVDDIVQDADGLDLSDSEDDEDNSAEDVDDEVFDSEEERELRLGNLEGELDGMYDEYKERMYERDAKFRVKQARLKDKNFDAWHGIKEKKAGADSDDDDEDDGVDKGYRDQMVRVRAPRRGDPDEQDDAGEESEEGGWDIRASAKAKIDESSDDDSSDEEGAGKKAKKPVKKAKKASAFDDDAGDSFAGRPSARGLVTSLQEPEQRAQMSRQAQLWFDQSVFKNAGDLAALDGDDEEEVDEEEEEESDVEEEEEDEDEEMVDAESDEDYDMADAQESSGPDAELVTDHEDDDNDDFEIVPQDADDDGPEWDVDDEDQDEVKKQIIKDKGLLTAEAVSLATALVNRKVTASQLIDQGFNRLSTHHKDGLPSWFLDDEAKHYKPNIPITAEAVAALRERQRALDARPIKKVAEAKARKKYKAVQRLEKAKKKAEGVLESEDLNGAEKARQVSKLIAKGMKGGAKKPEKKLVVARGANKGVQGRPKGVKGKYKMADARMKKEVRALKRVKKASTKKGGGRR